MGYCGVLHKGPLGFSRIFTGVLKDSKWVRRFGVLSGFMTGLYEGSRRFDEDFGGFYIRNALVTRAWFSVLRAFANLDPTPFKIP